MKKKEDSQKRLFPWEDVEACRNKQLEQGFSTKEPPARIGYIGEQLQGGPVDRDARGGNAWPVCGTPSEDLIWIYFVSPP